MGRLDPLSRRASLVTVAILMVAAPALAISSVPVAGVTPEDSGAYYPNPANATAPPLREQVCLNGIWYFTPEGEETTEIPVPEYWDAAPGFSCDNATYRREVHVPASWTDKIIKIEFEGVNQIAYVYVNGQLVDNHVGGWVPFSFDITDLVTPGEDFTLEVMVLGGNHQPIVDADGVRAWPIGWCGPQERLGICRDVFIRAYGMVHIEDAFIQPSYRNSNLTVDYTLTNSDSQAHTVTIEADAWLSGSLEKGFTGPTVTLDPGETRTVRMTGPWTDPVLWNPDSPVLYVLKSRLVEDGSTPDEEQRRFGFREMWVSGNQYMLNGHRINLYGTNTVIHVAPSHDNFRYHYFTRDTWPDSVDRMKKINMRILRFHGGPAPNWALDVADEKGLLIIAESVCMAWDLEGPVDRYISNAVKWIPQWVKGQRNHPSVVIWSAHNEIGCKSGVTYQHMQQLGEAIRAHDPTRPVIMNAHVTTESGDADGYFDEFNYHYPLLLGGYHTTFPGEWGIYRGGPLLKSKPTGIGEFLTSWDPPGGTNWWWHGTLIRGLRYLGFTDVRLSNLSWAWYGMPSENRTWEEGPLPLYHPQVVNLIYSWAEVALFDKEYDDLGIAPIRDGDCPTVDEGATLDRTLVLYNDEFEDTRVSVVARVESGGTTYAIGTGTYNVPLGEHVEIPCSFQVPYVGGSEVDLILSTIKGGALKFEGANRFYVRETGGGGATSDIVFLGGGDGNFVVENLRVSPTGVNLGGGVDISVDVANIGGATDSHTLTLLVNDNVENNIAGVTDNHLLLVDGAIEDLREVSLPGGTSTRVGFTVAKDEPGVYTVHVGKLGGSFTVLPFEFSDLSVSPESVKPGEDVAVSVDVTNVGGIEETMGVELSVNGEVVDSRSVTLPPGESETVQFTLSEDEEGTYEVEVGGLTDSFTVGVAVAEFELSDLSVSKATVEPGEGFTVSVIVTNTGGESGSYTVELSIDSETKTEDVTLDPGASETVTFEVSLGEEGTYTVSAGGMTGSFEVAEPEEGEIPWVPVAAGVVVVVAVVSVLVWKRRK